MDLKFMVKSGSRTEVFEAVVEHVIAENTTRSAAVLWMKRETLYAGDSGCTPPGYLAEFCICRNNV